VAHRSSRRVSPPRARPLPGVRSKASDDVAAFGRWAVAFGSVLSAADHLNGRPPPVKAAARPLTGITLRVSLDRRRSPGSTGHYEEMPSE
jgi:hypothetical protein